MMGTGTCYLSVILENASEERRTYRSTPRFSHRFSVENTSYGGTPRFICLNKEYGWCWLDGVAATTADGVA